MVASDGSINFALTLARTGELLEKDQLSKDDQAWLEKELEEMENRLKAYKRKYAGKVIAESAGRSE